MELRFVYFWQLTGWFLVLAVVVLSLLPSPPTPPGPLAWDKAQHVLCYALLMWWFRQAFTAYFRWPFFLLSLGIVLEFLQGWVGYREFSVADMLANALGIGTGLLLARYLTGPLFALPGALSAWLSKHSRLK